VVDEFGDGEPFLGVFGETAQDEGLDFRGGRLAAGEVDVVVDHLREVFLAADLEGHPTVEQLVGEDADVPDVHFVVVLLSLHDLGRGVDWTSAVRGA
jgi:hypothetical protein